MTTRNILTLRERRVLGTLFKVYKQKLAEPTLTLEQQRTVAEIVEVLEEVIDSASMPDEKWRAKYLHRKEDY